MRLVFFVIECYNNTYQRYLAYNHIEREVNMKKVLKHTLACIAILCTQFANLSAFATDSFSTIYSGKLKASDKVYMDLSTSDAKMVKVIYAASGSKNKFLTISDASSYSFTSKYFIAKYTKDGEFTDLNGKHLEDAKQPIIIQTTDISPEKNVFGYIINVSLVYNGCTYSSKL